MKFNFYKFQKTLSVVPYYSTVFIYLVCMFKLASCKTTYQNRQQFIALFFIPNIALFVLNELFLNRLGTAVSMIIGGILLIPVNFALVALQEKIDNSQK